MANHNKDFRKETKPPYFMVKDDCCKKCGGALVVLPPDRIWCESQTCNQGFLLLVGDGTHGVEQEPYRTKLTRPLTTFELVLLKEKCLHWSYSNELKNGYIELGNGDGGVTALLPYATLMDINVEVIEKIHVNEIHAHQAAPTN